MKKYLIKICMLSTILSLFLTSCNLDVEETKYTNDFGIITDYTAPDSYTIKTDKGGSILSYKTNISIKKEDIGKRVYLSYNLIATNSPLVKYAEIKSLRTVYMEKVIFKTKYDEMNEEDQDKYFGATPVEHIVIDHVNDYMNISFLTLSNKNHVSNGRPILIYDDINSTDKIKKFTWQFKAEGDTYAEVMDYVTFDISGVMVIAQEYDIEISYKSFGDIEVAKYTLVKTNVIQ